MSAWNPIRLIGRLTAYLSYDLPSDVFDAGEERPLKAKKAKAATKKRSFAQSSMEVCRLQISDDAGVMFSWFLLTHFETKQENDLNITKRRQAANGLTTPD